MNQYINRIELLRKHLVAQGLDGYILSSYDEFGCSSEEASPLAWLTGFTSSNATLIVFANILILYTDSRYLQAAEEHFHILFEEKNSSDKSVARDIKEQNEYRILNISSKNACNAINEYSVISKNTDNNRKIGFASKYMKFSDFLYFRNLAASSASFTIETSEAISQVFYDCGFSPAIFSSTQAFEHSGVFHGEDLASKKKRTLDTFSKYSGNIFDPEFNLCAQTEQVQIEEGHYLLIADLSSIAWFMNIRGHDFSTFPVIACRLFVSVYDASLYLIARKEILIEATSYFDRNQIVVFENINEFISIQKPKVIYLSHHDLSYEEISLLAQQVVIYNVKNPCIDLKARKNEIELRAMALAHLHDCVAMHEFQSWLDQHCTALMALRIDEISCSEKVTELRSQFPLFYTNSFAPISGYASNSAKPHYHPTQDSNRTLNEIYNDEEQSCYLLDSGGHYICGTTDITRVFWLMRHAEPPLRVKQNYTAVLRGHILLASLVFPDGSITGGMIDVMARRYLWAKGMDYGHGTGHGVGMTLNVHEGPQSLTLRSNEILRQGMVLSIEPGVYIDNAYGFRIENLYYIDFYKPDLSYKDLLTRVVLHYSNVHPNLHLTELLLEELKRLPAYIIHSREKLRDEELSDEESTKVNKSLQFYPLTFAKINERLVDSLDSYENKWLYQYNEVSDFIGKSSILKQWLKEFVFCVLLVIMCGLSLDDCNAVKSPKQTKSYAKTNHKDKDLMVATLSTSDITLLYEKGEVLFANKVYIDYPKEGCKIEADGCRGTIMLNESKNQDKVKKSTQSTSEANDITGDLLSKAEIHCNKSAMIQCNTVVIRGTELYYFAKDHLLQIAGNVHGVFEKNEIYADKIEYSIPDKRVKFLSNKKKKSNSVQLKMNLENLVNKQ